VYQGIIRAKGKQSRSTYYIVGVKFINSRDTESLNSRVDEENSRGKEALNSRGCVLTSRAHVLNSRANHCLEIFWPVLVKAYAIV
jgi:hypothetical protein